MCSKQTYDFRHPKSFSQLRNDKIKSKKIVDLKNSPTYINARQERIGELPNAIFS